MVMKKIFLLLALAGMLQLLPGCTGVQQPKTTNESLLIATLYHQKSAERDALCYQAYNVARCRLDEILAQNANPDSLAIVLDLDETVLDNSPYEAKTILNHFTYPTGWDEWMHAAEAKAIPGSVDFLHYAADRGISIFYITNRKEKYREATMENLHKLGIAPATEDHLLLRTDASSKQPRREKVLKDHRIIMLFGDNLADFSKVFDGKETPEERARLVDSLQLQFGKRFIVFPNAMYGDWLNAITGYNYSLKPAQQLQLQKKSLQGF